MNKCRFCEQLSTYFDNQLQEVQRRSLEEHLKTCVLCQQELAKLKKISERLKKWQAPGLGTDFDSAVRNKIVRWELERGEEKMKKTFPILVPSAVLAGVLVFVFVGILLKQGYYGKLGQVEVARTREVSPVIKTGGQTTTTITPVTQLPVAKLKIDTAKTEMLADNFATGTQAFEFNKDMKDMSMYSSTRAAGVYNQSIGTPGQIAWCPAGDFNTEQYNRIYDNDYQLVANNSLSTFSIDVDTASYSNVRRFLTQNQMPPKDSVRIEELVNYFSYDYPQPQNNDPFSVTTEVGTCPWNKEHQLVLIGLQAKKIDTKNLPKSNLVFLLDVSGSMQDVNKLPLIKSAFRLLVNQLKAEDRISIVAYASSAGVILDSAQGDEKEKILQAIDNLTAGGSTAGAAGIELAYEIAKKNLFKDGNNRVILATDGDFNTGISSDSEVIRLIEEKRNDGIFLSILGFGMGNYKDAKMEQLADKGNGMVAYVDNLLEAKKVFVNQLAGTLFTVAKDVKIQVEFNPAQVKAYRLVGYENRKLENKDFNDDKKDAGEIGAGHTVTALYEIALAGSKEDFPGTDALKYQKVTVTPSNELLTVKLRYKEPAADQSKLLAYTLQMPKQASQLSENYNFATSVAEFGLILRDSQYKGSATYQDVIARAKASKGKDDDGYRAEFIKIVELAQMLDIKTK